MAKAFKKYGHRQSPTCNVISLKSKLKKNIEKIKYGTHLQDTACVVAIGGIGEEAECKIKERIEAP